MQDIKFKIIIYDEKGIELLRTTRYRLNCFISDFIVNEVYDQKIVSPLIHKQSRECFYPAGNIQLMKTEENKTSFVQNGIVIFEFYGSLIEFKTLSSSKFTCPL
jgi:hypothetical protein